jgi:hypothetical protein
MHVSPRSFPLNLNLNLNLTLGMPHRKVLYFLWYVMTDHSASAISGDARDVSISMGRVNIMAIPVAFGALAIAGTPFILLHGWSALAQSARQFFLPSVGLPVLAIGIIFHELIHGAAWAYYGEKPLIAIRFGVNWRLLTPYAHCPEPLSAGAYRLGAAAPGILLGILPTVIATWTGPPWLFISGLLFTVAAAGDILVLWIIRNVPSHLLVQDHPTRAGCIVYNSANSKEQNV